MRLGANHGPWRPARCAAAAILLLAVGSYAASSAAATHGQTVHDAAHGDRSGKVARAQTVRDAARLHLVGGRGSTALTERGEATGTLPGAVLLHLRLHGYTASAEFTLYTKAGEITGHGKGRLKFGKGGYDSFAATATITHGTGRYAHAKGKGHIYGSIYRGNYRMGLHVLGLLHY